MHRSRFLTRKIIHYFFLGLFFNTAAFAGAQNNTISLQGDSIVFETDHLRYVAGTDGMLREFTDISSGKNYLDTSGRTPFLAIQKNDRWIGSTAVELAHGFLYVTFGDSGVWARIHPRAFSSYLTFELSSVNDHSITALRLAYLPLTIKEWVSSSITSCRNAEFGACIIPLNIETVSSPSASPKTLLQGWCEQSVRLEGAKIAVAGCPTGKLLDTIELIEKENGLPHPTLDGVWAKKSREVMKSYLFTDLSEDIADSMIDYAKTGGFGYITIYTGVWNKTHGSYLVNETAFPHGAAGLKATTDKIHAAGLRVGMHVLDAVISKDDPLVKNPSDPGFLKYPNLRRILAADIGSADVFIPTTVSPEGLLSKADKSRYHGRDLLIDNEIITYDDIKTDPPYGFAGCVRGARESRPAAHKKDAFIDNFAEFIDFYLPDLQSSLYDRVAQGEASALDDYGFDYIYPDGTGENIGYYPRSPQWYYMNLLTSRLYNNTKREVMWGHGPISNYSWHVYARGNTVDYASTGIIQHFNHTSLANSRYSIADMQPFEFGWFGYFTRSLEGEATRPREMEYAWSKALAYGAAMSLETNKAALDANGRTREIFAMIKNWEDLKLSDYFPEPVMEKMREPGKEFTLDKDNSGKWAAFPITYGPDRYTADGASNNFTQTNPYAAQPLRVIIQNMPRLAEYGSRENIILLQPGPLNLNTKGRGPLGSESHTSSGVTFDIAASDKPARSSGKSFSVNAKNGGTSPEGWGCAEIILDKPLDLSSHRAVGTWVYGDKSGTCLHFILEDGGRWSVRDFWVKLDFTGWKYIKIPEAAKGEVYDFAYPYNNYWAIRAIDFKSISRVYVFITGLAPDKSANCYFSRLEALRETPLPLSHPSLTVNGKNMVFPATLGPDCYLEYQGEHSAKVFDPNGFSGGEVTVTGDVPELKPGVNTVKFKCDTDAQNGKTARITIMLRGESLK